MSWSIPGLHSHGSMTIQLKNNDGRGDNMQDIENVSLQPNLTLEAFDCRS